MDKYLLTNLTDVQQVVEFGKPEDLNSVTILPAKARITIHIPSDIVVILKAKLENVVAFRKL